jgi:starvation-inducible outer membrane lipoprotein
MNRDFDMKDVATVLAGGVLLLSLGGCATVPKTLEISCFANEDSTKAKVPVEGQGPLITSNGTAIFYNTDGQLIRVKDAVCGIK